MISSDLKPSHHCSEEVKTANKLVSFIGCVFENKSEEIILKLYNSLVRLHLNTAYNYCFHITKESEKLERV